MDIRAAARSAWAVWAVWVVWAATVAGAVAFVVLEAARSHAPGSSSWFNAQQAVGAVIFPTVGAIVAIRRPRNPIAWLFLIIGASLSISSVASALADTSATGSQPWRWGYWLKTWSWAPGWVLMVTLLLLLFPDGRLPSPRWRWATWLSVIGLALQVVGGPLDPAAPRVAGYHSPLPTNAVLGGFGELSGTALGLIAAVASIVALVQRFRRSTGDERQQMKWFVYGGLMTVLLLPARSVLADGRPIMLTLGFLSFPILPLAVSVAILKHRLYDIDVVISRTVLYGALAAFIALVYVAVVVGLGSVIGSTGGPNLGLSIAATAIVAFAFQPVRERLQRVANRLVYGERATPYEVLSDFSERIGGAIEDDRVLPAMARVVAEGTGAATATVWLRHEGSLAPAASWPERESQAMPPPEPVPVDGGLPAIPGADVAVPVRHQGDLLGALAVVKRPGEAITPAEAKLLEDLSSQAGLVLRNVALTADLQARLTQVERQAGELRASRQRIVAAADAERRRLERDIHDGAQQHLVALAVRIRLARTLVARDPERAARMLEELRGQVADGMATLRRLASGIYPDALVERGLVAALEGVASQAPVPVAVRAERVGRRPPQVEAAVYFCVLEALQNIAKYAQAEGVVVRLTGSDGDLGFEVEDDGRGFVVPEAVGGTGLQGMADRLAAVGGALEVRSAPGAGTNVIGRVPARAMEQVG